MLEEIVKNAWHIPILMAMILVYGFLLNRVLFRPVMAVLDERKKRIRDADSLSEESKETLKRRFQEYELAILEAHRRATQVKEAARSEAYEYRSKVLAEVKGEMDGELRAAEADLKSGTEKVRRELAATVPELARMMAEKVLGREVAL